MARMAIDHYNEISQRILDPKFMLIKETEIMLMKKFPKKFRSREKIILFGKEKYHEAFMMGEKNHQILQELTREIESVDEVDLKLAEKLIESGPSHAKIGHGMSINPTMYYM